MISIWKDLQQNLGGVYEDIIQEGIAKLDTYHDRIELVPAYTISMSKTFTLIFRCFQQLTLYLVLNPSMKLKYIPYEKHAEAKDLLCRTVSLQQFRTNIDSKLIVYLLASSLL